jgi:hypothetical protein
MSIRSFYELVFSPKRIMSADSSVYIRFPANYDTRISEIIFCISPHLKGQLKCTASQGVLLVNGYEEFSAVNTPVNITLINVVNPNKMGVGLELTAPFDIGIISGGKMSEYKRGVQGLEIGTEPGVLDVISVSASNNWGRFQSSYSFLFKPTINMASGTDGGVAVVYLPPQFDLEDSPITCEGNDTFGDKIACVSAGRFVIMPAPAAGFTAAPDAFVNITIHGITNPQTDGETGDFRVFLMD